MKNETLYVLLALGAIGALWWWSGRQKLPPAPGPSRLPRPPDPCSVGGTGCNRGTALTATTLPWHVPTGDIGCQCKDGSRSFVCCN